MPSKSLYVCLVNPTRGACPKYDAKMFNSWFCLMLYIKLTKFGGRGGGLSFAYTLPRPLLSWTFPPWVHSVYFVLYGPLHYRWAWRGRASDLCLHAFPPKNKTMGIKETCRDGLHRLEAERSGQESIIAQVAKAIIFKASSLHGLRTHHKETFNFFLKC